jgi:hypothetical protein
MTTTSRHALGQTLKKTALALIASGAAAATIGLAPSAHAEPEASPAAHGVEAPIGAIPWSQVGLGWTLATWSPVSGQYFGEEAHAGEPTRE